MDERNNSSNNGNYGFSDNLMGNEENFVNDKDLQKVLGSLKEEWKPWYHGAYAPASEK